VSGGFDQLAESSESISHLQAKRFGGIGFEDFVPAIASQNFHPKAEPDTEVAGPDSASRGKSFP
jgi:hypothetical protein